MSARLKKGTGPNIRLESNDTVDPHSYKCRAQSNLEFLAGSNWSTNNRPSWKGRVLD